MTIKHNADKSRQTRISSVKAILFESIPETLTQLTSCSIWTTEVDGNKKSIIEKVLKHTPAG